MSKNRSEVRGLSTSGKWEVRFHGDGTHAVEEDSDKRGRRAEKKKKGGNEEILQKRSTACATHGHPSNPARTRIL